MMDDSNEMVYVYPEQYSKQLLLQQLSQFGMERSLLEKLEENIQDLVECFYETLSSLPRRPPRDNRRGKILEKLHQKEDRLAASKRPVQKTSTPARSVQSTTSTRGCHASNLSVNSTTEMDRLEARSKAAKQAKSAPVESKRIKLSHKEDGTKPVESKRIKLSIKGDGDKSVPVESKKLSPNKESGKLAPTEPKELSLNKKVGTKLSNSVTSQTSATTPSKAQPTAPAHVKQPISNHRNEQQINTTESSNKVVRKKLKRNFLPPTVPQSAR